jgi:hypothetical protein
MGRGFEGLGYRTGVGVLLGSMTENLRFLLPQEAGQWGPVSTDFRSYSPSSSPLKEALAALSQPCLTVHLPYTTGLLHSVLLRQHSEGR